jgi:hypothetical protein
MVVRRQAGKACQIWAAKDDPAHMRAKLDHLTHRQPALAKLMSHPFDFVFHHELR